MPSDTGQQQIGGESGSGEHAGDASAVTSPDIAEISARAKENLKQYVIRGIINDEFVPAFFSSIQKVPANIGLGAAAVTMTENGIKLIYDIHHFAKFSKEEIDFVLSHELMHVLSYHFLRGEELMAEIGVGKSVV